MSIDRRVLYHNILRSQQTAWGEIPQRAHSGIDQSVGHSLSLLHRHRYHTDLGLHVGAHLRHLRDIKHRHTRYNRPYDGALHIETGHDIESVATPLRL